MNRITLKRYKIKAPLGASSLLVVVCFLSVLVVSFGRFSFVSSLFGNHLIALSWLGLVHLPSSPCPPPYQTPLIHATVCALST
jgi:hypothetical protein